MKETQINTIVLVQTIPNATLTFDKDNIIAFIGPYDTELPFSIESSIITSTQSAASNEGVFE
jgi:hypothetical protein